MSSSWSLLGQKLLVAVSFAAALVLLWGLARRRLGAYEDSHAARERLVYRALVNVSLGLDRLAVGLDDLAARAALAKAKLGQLASTARRGLVAWAALRDKAERDFEAKRRRRLPASLGTPDRRTSRRTE